MPDTDGANLTTAQLADLSEAIVRDESIWRPMVIADPDRLRAPLVRRGDEYVEVTKGLKGDELVVVSVTNAAQ